MVARARRTHPREAAAVTPLIDRSSPHYAAWMATDGLPATTTSLPNRLASMAAGGLLGSRSLAALAPLWQAALNNLETALLRHLAAARAIGVQPVAGLR
jgi:hypothetical protein